MTSRIGGALVGLLAVGVVAGTAAMWVDFNHRVDHAAAEAADSAGPLPGSPSSASPSPTAQPKLVSLWVGDGYTAGAGATKPQRGESCSAAHRLGWTCELDAERGTGFLSDGSSFSSSYGTVGDRLDQLPKKAPDVVVVDAGRNDVGVYSQAAIVAAMGDYLAKLHARYPDATLIQIVPWRLGQEAADKAMTAAVTTLIKRYDGYVVDPVAEGWAGAGKTDKPELLADDGVADQDGHTYIGQHLAAAIRALDLPVMNAG